MQTGDVIKTTYLRISHHPQVGWSDYKSNKGYHMLFVYLGSEPKDGSEPLDVFRQLELMGWRPTPELAEHIKEFGYVPLDEELAPVDTPARRALEPADAPAS